MALGPFSFAYLCKHYFYKIKYSEVFSGLVRTCRKFSFVAYLCIVTIEQGAIKE